jgi:hypothetical protein
MGAEDQILPVEHGDLDAIIDLFLAEGWVGYARIDLESILRVSPGMSLKLVREGEIIGTMFSSKQATVAHMGFFIIRKDCRRSFVAFGFGRQAVAATTRQAELTITYANDTVINAYTRAGFTAAGAVTRFQFGGEPGPLPDGVTPLDFSSDGHAIERLNEQCYRNPRPAVTSVYARYPEVRGFVYQATPAAEAAGYILVRKFDERYLAGPLIAEHTAAAGALLQAVRRSLPGATIIADAPPETFAQLLSTNGIAAERRKSAQKMYVGNATLLERSNFLHAIGAYHFG